jgi:TetR/AcrR family transcriptional regulator
MIMDKDTKSKLIEAAIPLFPQKGYAGVSIREIADAAGVNSASISYYFGGKEGLYEAVLESIFSQIDAIVDPPESESGPMETFAHEFAMKAQMMHKKNPYLIKYLYMEMSHPTKFRDSILKKYLGKLYRFLYKGIEDSIQNGEFRPDLDIGYAAFSLSALINAYFIVAPMRRSVMQRDGDDLIYIEQAVDLFLNGVRRRNHD